MVTVSIKRIFDVVMAIVLLILLFPLLIILALMVRIELGSPILFEQERPGWRGHRFKMYKFRTMTDDLDENGNLRSDADRLTLFGKFLRNYSLDELPELVNVLRGEMSLVGPRPLLMHYLERYSPEEARRHEVKPGITGWAQVNGRNAISWSEKFKLDVWYVDNWNLALDLKILYLTIVKVLKKEGITQANHATAEEFMGSSTNNHANLDS